MHAAQAGKSGAGTVLDAGAVAENLAAAVGKPESGSALGSKLASAQKAVSLLEQANSELQKTAGMNPRTVVGILKDLPAQLQPIAGCQAYVQSTEEVVQQFRGKLRDACSKAQEAGDATNSRLIFLAVSCCSSRKTGAPGSSFQADAATREKKMAALLQLAEEGDGAQRALAELGTFRVESFAQVIRGFTAQSSLEAVEAELSKETGMNSKAVLSGLQEAGKVLPTLDEELSSDLKSRARESCEKVSKRMVESLEDAVKTSNEAKQKALLGFAKEFDAACSALTDGSLEAELQKCLGTSE